MSNISVWQGYNHWLKNFLHFLDQLRFVLSTALSQLPKHKEISKLKIRSLFNLFSPRPAKTVSFVIYQTILLVKGEPLGGKGLIIANASLWM